MTHPRSLDISLLGEFRRLSRRVLTTALSQDTPPKTVIQDGDQEGGTDRCLQ